MVRLHSIDVYDAWLHISDDPKKSLIGRDDGGIDGNSSCEQLVGYRNKWCVAIYLKDGCVRTACHEAVHGAFDLLSQKGANIDRDNQEPLAYLTDFIFAKCLDFLEAKRRRGGVSEVCNKKLTS